MVTDAPLTLIPTGELVMVEVDAPEAADADAVILTAPEESRLAEFTITDATPLELVSAVADVGENVTRFPEAANVMTALAMGDPFASL